MDEGKLHSMQQKFFRAESQARHIHPPRADYRRSARRTDSEIGFALFDGVRSRLQKEAVHPTPSQ